jgi:hypothetical protein
MTKLAAKVPCRLTQTQLASHMATTEPIISLPTSTQIDPEAHSPYLKMGTWAFFRAKAAGVFS